MCFCDFHYSFWNESESHSVVSDSLRLYSPWNSSGQNTGVGSLSLLQGIFPNHGSNPGLLRCRQILYKLSHRGSPRILEWVASHFSSGSSWVGKIHWRRDRLPTPVFLGFPCGSAGKESTCNAGDLGSIPELGRTPGEGKGYPLQYSCLRNPHGQRSLAGYSPWGRRVRYD